MQPWKLVVILIFCFVLRGIFTVLLIPVADEYYLNLAGQSLFNLALFWFCVYEFSLNRERISEIFGCGRGYEIVRGVGLAVLLLMFTFGESALRTLALANWNLSFAYEFGNFHEEYYSAHPFMSVHVLSYVVTSVFMPAIIEEFFFRGLLFPAFAVNRGYAKAAILSSLIFTLIHLNKSANLSAFLFSFVLCCFYVRATSLWGCISVHAIFNLLAFVSQYYFDFHRTRAIDRLSSVSDWIPELTMLIVSLGCFALLFLRQSTIFSSTCNDRSVLVRFKWLQSYGIRFGCPR